MNIKHLALLVFGGLAIYYWRLAQVADKISITPGAIRKFRVTPGGITWEQTFNVNNPANMPIPVGPSTLTAYFNNLQVGNATLTGFHWLGSAATTPLVFQVTVGFTDLQGLAEGVKATLLSGTAKIKYTGTFGTLGLKVPVQETYQFTNLPKF